MRRRYPYSIIERLDPSAYAINGAWAMAARLTVKKRKFLLVMDWIGCYGEIALLYAEDLTIFRRTQHRPNNGVDVRRMSLVSFFVLNCYYCLQGTRAQFFGMLPPTLEVYLPLNEMMQPPPHVRLGDVYDFGRVDPLAEDGDANSFDHEDDIV